MQIQNEYCIYLTYSKRQAVTNGADPDQTLQNAAFVWV